MLVTQLCPALCDPMDSNPPGSSVEFSRQEYWSGLPFPSAGDLPYPGIEPMSPALQANLFKPPGAAAAICNISSVQSLSRVQLSPPELQHARPPCISPTPGVHPNSCPLS